MVTLYGRPQGHLWRLALAPVLETWNRSGDPAQMRMKRYLEHVVSEASAFMVDGIPLALDLTVEAPQGQPLTDEHELDNYLKPVVAKLGHDRLSQCSDRSGVRATRR